MLITITDSVDDVKPCGEAAPLLPLPRVGGELGGQRCVLRVQPRLGGGVPQGLQRLLEVTCFNTQFCMCILFAFLNTIINWSLNKLSPPDIGMLVSRTFIMGGLFAQRYSDRSSIPIKG